MKIKKYSFHLPVHHIYIGGNLVKNYWRESTCILWSHMAKLSRFHSENFWNNETPFYVDKRMHFIWLSLDWQKKNQMCLLKIRNMNCRANGYNHHCETIFNSTYKLIKMNRCMHFYIMTLKILITGTLIRFQASFLSQNVYD